MFHACTRLCLALCAVVALASLERWAGAAPEQHSKNPERDHWESVILFYGDEETGEWSLRIDDKDVKQRAWFEYIGLWQFDIKEEAWQEVKSAKFQKPIVLPKQKGTDQPENNQVLVNLEEIPVHTAGLWYARWKVDNVEGGTLMRVGTNRASNKVQEAPPPPGMMKVAVPVSLEKAVGMIIPDPRIYCVIGGPGKPAPSTQPGHR